VSPLKRFPGGRSLRTFTDIDAEGYRSLDDGDPMRFSSEHCPRARRVLLPCDARRATNPVSALPIRSR